ncbi:LPS export ABC transporter periplasmic protein LptC [Postechiella marina]|uniref:LPS export ABC transporter periplasmic protein LptC n=2 Tax=Postechiella marina TaxID=943941 RepID=A0ABP8CBP8_9FLAO
MKLISTYRMFNIVTAIAVTMFFSCNNNLSQVNKIGVSENEPIAEAVDLNFKYIDSGRVKSILISPQMLDYSNRSYPYKEFPKGLDLEVFNEDNKRSNIIADYAIIYDLTNLIDLQGNVKLITADKDTLFAEQLYYDNTKGWLFTNKPVKFRTGLDLIHGNGFDSNSKFTNAEVLEVSGIVTLDE